ncbi:MAG: spore coat protein CotJB [Tissierellaceae bacterium]
MTREQMDLLVEIMEVGFAITETSLYLNSHPDDSRALQLHNSNCQRYEQLILDYESRYSPLRNISISRYPWAYIDEPWPWDINFTNF